MSDIHMDPAGDPEKDRLWYLEHSRYSVLGSKMLQAEIDRFENKNPVCTNYVTRMRKGWPGYLNRRHRAWLFKYMMMGWLTNMDPCVFWFGKRLP